MGLVKGAKSFVIMLSKLEKYTGIYIQNGTLLFNDKTANIVRCFCKKLLGQKSDM